MGLIGLFAFYLTFAAIVSVGTQPESHSTDNNTTFLWLTWHPFGVLLMIENPKEMLYGLTIQTVVCVVLWVWASGRLASNNHDRRPLILSHLSKFIKRTTVRRFATPRSAIVWNEWSEQRRMFFGAILIFSLIPILFTYLLKKHVVITEFDGTSDIIPHFPGKQ